MNKLILRCVIVLMLFTLISGCQKEASQLDTLASLDNANMILFNDTVEYSGDGISVTNNVVSVTKGGSYVVSGASENGQIVIDTKDEEVELILDNLTLNCQTSAPIYVLDAKKVTITLNDNTQNTLSDTAQYTINSEEEPSATIFSKADLILKGSGTLIVNAMYNDAICSKDTLTIESGTYQIQSVDDGIIGKDTLTIYDGTFTMNTKGDAFKSTNDTDADMGNILLQQGTYSITCNGDGFQAVNNFQIEAGNFDIQTTSLTSSDSTKGIKAQNITVNGGHFVIDSIDDSIHANHDVLINNGTFTLNSQDDAIHSDNLLTFNEGTLLISSSYEGLEANEIIINGGSIDLTSSDDGLNAAGGNDQSNGMGMFGGDSFSSGDSQITINNGTIIVNAGGDGIDANGSIYINGGTTYVNGPTNQGNGALDYDKECIISGGTLLTLGTSAMLQGPSTSSSQYAMMIGLNSSYQAGTKVTIKNSQGTTIHEYTSLKAFQAIVFSDSSLKQGESYTIELNGTVYTTVTLSSIVTSNINTTNQMGQPNNRRV